MFSPYDTGVMNTPLKALRPLALLTAGTLALTACATDPVPAYDASGTWKGNLTVAGASAPFTAIVKDENGKLSGTVNFDSGSTTPAPFTGSRSAANTATLNVPQTVLGSLSIDGTFSGKTFAGTYRVNGGAATAFSMTQQ